MDAGDDAKRLSMLKSGMDKFSIARKLKRTPTAVKSRLSKLRQIERQKANDRDDPAPGMSAANDDRGLVGHLAFQMRLRSNATILSG
jgi:hypothetical protein